MSDPDTPEEGVLTENTKEIPVSEYMALQQYREELEAISQTMRSRLRPGRFRTHVAVKELLEDYHKEKAAADSYGRQLLEMGRIKLELERNSRE